LKQSGKHSYEGMFQNSLFHGFGIEHKILPEDAKHQIKVKNTH